MTALVLAALGVLAWPEPAVATRVRAQLGAGRRGSWSGRAGRFAATPVVLTVSGATALVFAGPLQSAAAVLLAGVVVEIRAAATRRSRETARLLAWEGALDRAVSAVAAGAEGPAVLAEAAAGGRESRGDDVLRALTVAHGEARLGGSAAESLRRADDEEARGLGAALLLAERHGVPLAAVLDGARSDVARRRERAGRVTAALAGPRATAVILTALPGLGVLLGTGFGADPLKVLTGGPLGGALCLAGAVLLAAGLLWTERIVTGAAR